MRPIADHDADTFELTRLVDAARVPCELDGTPARLRIQQVVVVEDGQCRTESATYSLQADASPKSWSIRWDYVRDPESEYAYPRAHVHVNATFADGSPVGHLHIPTGRVPLEFIIRYLISDCGVKSKSKDSEAILEESAAGFDDASHRSPGASS